MLKARKPVAIIDIGSNSIRLVIYENLTRSLTPLYNEKSVCSLGKGVALLGSMNASNVAKALKVMRRFALVIRLMQVKNIYCFATSAVREANNGEQFASDVTKIIGVRVDILSGEQEAYFATLGTIAGIPDFTGEIGDLGGGSLELSSLVPAKESNNETYKLGVISLKEESNFSLKKAMEIVKNQLKTSKVLAQKSDNFCAIGGTFREIAKLHQALTNYPLHMVQNYQVRAFGLIGFCNEIIEQYINNKTYEGIEFVSSSRTALLPFGAVVLRDILQIGAFENVIFSALGVREGYLYDKLSKIEQQYDPLFETCKQISILRSRSFKHSFELIDFSEQFISAVNIKEAASEKRLREAACLLADISWRGHPDYRGEQAVDLIAFGALVGINHSGRAFLAKALAVRYMGLKRQSISKEILQLAGKREGERARIIGALFRVAFVISASMAGVLPKVKFNINSNIVELILPNELSFLEGNHLKSRLNQLAKLLGLVGEIVITDL